MADMILGQPAAGGAPPADLVKDSDTAHFMADVIEASQTTPVVVDFWAPWCGPCKQLTPTIEKVIKGTRGAVKLVKINIDENQELAAQLRIQSIPTVFAFAAGRPVDGFAGALPESQVKAFVDRLLATAGGAAQESPIADALNQAKALFEAGDAKRAAALYGQVLAAEPENVAAIAGLARAQVANGELDKARETLAKVPEAGKGDAEVAAAKAALDLAEKSKGAGNLSELEARLAADPNDLQARFDRALALYGMGRREEAIDELLAILKKNREWNDQAARKQLVQFFEAQGPKDPLTLSGRRKLSSILFS
ncbi:MAG TPA: thioredoxin [Rhodospirillales bacterium]